ncbi:MAG TPA: hypothetical protein DEP46_07825 [Blastocatellia bacterium]|nr:hypothetical protein [Blastocatellia bacterium]
MTPKQRQQGVFHEPIRPKDSSTQTEGCRHTNPDICASNQMPGVCAFVRADAMCIRPPRSWAKQFQALKNQQEKRDSELLRENKRKA